MIIGVDVAPLPFGPVLEVNRFFWAVVEAGHATHAMIAPHREALFKFDVMKRTAHVDVFDAAFEEKALKLVGIGFPVNRTEVSEVNFARIHKRSFYSIRIHLE